MDDPLQRLVTASRSIIPFFGGMVSWTRISFILTNLLAVRDHPLSKYVKFSEKPLFLTS